MPRARKEGFYVRSRKPLRRTLRTDTKGVPVDRRARLAGARDAERLQWRTAPRQLTARQDARGKPVGERARDARHRRGLPLVSSLRCRGRRGEGHRRRDLRGLPRTIGSSTTLMAPGTKDPGGVGLHDPGGPPLSTVARWTPGD